MSENKLPNVIILYGPPAAGKGTQAHFLKQNLPDRYHLDFGTELRSFVNKYLGDYTNLEEELQSQENEHIRVARRIKSDMKANLPVQTSDLRYVIESGINECIERGQDMIIEGPGRLVEEAKWLSGFMTSKDVSVCIFHLYVSIEEVISRSSTRYYLPSTRKPFTSLESAQMAAINDEKPYRRPEDEDEMGIRQRYRLLYSDNFAKIISIYQLQAKSPVFTLDASQEIKQVSTDILKYFEVFYGVEIDTK